MLHMHLKTAAVSGVVSQDVHRLLIDMITCIGHAAAFIVGWSFVAPTIRRESSSN
jgi:hypothetical protein